MTTFNSCNNLKCLPFRILFTSQPEISTSRTIKWSQWTIVAVQVRAIKYLLQTIFQHSSFLPFSHHCSYYNYQYRQELMNEGLWDSVTLVMTSEFGRTVTPNASGGSNHGWGGNYFVMGGQIKGGRVLGKHPMNYNSNNPHITGRGAWIPTTSNEAMWVSISSTVCGIKPLFAQFISFWQTFFVST